MLLRAATRLLPEEAVLAVKSLHGLEDEPLRGTAGRFWEGCGVLDLELVAADGGEDEDADDFVLVRCDEVATVRGVYPGLKRCLWSSRIRLVANSSM